MERALLEWRVAVADFQLYLAQRRLGRAIDEMVRKYRPDQPRMPRGVPEGGEWVIDPNSARQRRLAGERVRVAFAAVLLTQRVGLGDIGMVRHCIYQDMLGRQLTREIDATRICPPTIKAPPYNGSW